MVCKPFVTDGVSELSSYTIPMEYHIVLHYMICCVISMIRCAVLVGHGIGQGFTHSYITNAIFGVGVLRLSSKASDKNAKPVS